MWYAQLRKGTSQLVNVLEEYQYNQRPSNWDINYDFVPVPDDAYDPSLGIDCYMFENGNLVLTLLGQKITAIQEITKENRILHTIQIDTNKYVAVGSIPKLSLLKEHASSLSDYSIPCAQIFNVYELNSEIEGNTDNQSVYVCATEQEFVDVLTAIEVTYAKLYQSVRAATASINAMEDISDVITFMENYRLTKIAPSILPLS